MTTKFMIGDRVAAARHAPSGKTAIRENDCGTVCYFDGDGMVSVWWDKDIHGHDCGGRCEVGHGWKVWPKDLILLGEEAADFDINEGAFMSII